MSTHNSRLCARFFRSTWLNLFGVMLALSFLVPSLARAEKGINGNELYGLPPAELQETVAGYKALGVSWVRFDFDWSVMQPTRTSYRTAGHDAAVAALGKAGIKVLGIIDYTPAWANGGQASKYYPPTNPKTFADFAAFLASRYGPMGVKTWEIWNEPNLGSFWGPAPDPSAYATLLRHTYLAIKRADPSAMVITGGLAQPSTTAQSMDSVQFLQLLYGSGAKPYFDAVGNHPYTAPVPPANPDAYNWYKQFSTPVNMRSVMLQYNDGAKRIWITEFGAPTAGVSPWGTVTTEEMQATMVTQTYQLASSYSWAGPVFWYNYKDFCTYSQTASSECFYGMVRYDGSAKPAFAAYQAAN